MRIDVWCVENHEIRSGLIVLRSLSCRQFNSWVWSSLQYSCLENPMDGGAWKAAVHGVAEGWTWLSHFTFTFHFHALGKEMATHSSVLAWRIPGMGEPGGLPSMGSHRVGHNWSDLAAAAAEKQNVEIALWELRIYRCVCGGGARGSVDQLCLIFHDPINCSPSGFSVYAIFLAKILEWVVISFSRVIFPVQRSNLNFLCLLHWEVDSLPMSYLGIPRNG